MRSTRTFRLSLAVGALFILVTASGLAGQSYQDDERAVAPLLKGCRTCLARWTANAYLSLFLAGAVLALGIVLATLKKNDRKYKRQMVVLGLAISILTALSGLAFEMNHKTYFRWAAQGREQMVDIQAEIVGRYSPEGDQKARLEWIDRVKAKIHKLHAIPNPLASLSRDRAAFSFAPALYAQASSSREPGWLKALPSDKDNFYFVGIGESADLQAAKESSAEAAVSAATEFFKSQFEINWGRGASSFDARGLAAYVAQAGKTADAYYRYDPVAARYRYYSLLRLNAKTLEIDLRLFLMGEKAPVPRDASAVIQSTYQILGSDYARQIAARDQALDQAKASLASPLYEEFVSARQLREKGDPQQAALFLEKIVSARPDFYPGWYELALAYDAQNDAAKAAGAFAKAAALEPAQSPRDSAFYVKYGEFLMRRNRTDEATAAFNEAIKLDPVYRESPGLKRLLGIRR